MKNGQDKTKGHVLKLTFGTSKLTVRHDPETGDFESEESTGAVAAARGMLAMAEKALLTRDPQDIVVAVNADLGDMHIECNGPSPVALGLVLMARDFWTLAWNIQCQTNIVAQMRGQVAQPNETQRRVFSH